MKKHSFMLKAAISLVLAASTTQAADRSITVAEQLQRLQQALSAQQAQLDAQREQLAAQAAELAALRAQLPTPEKQAEVASLQSDVAKLNRDAQTAKLTQQETPRWTFTAARPTITSADGRSSLSVRAITQLDTAHYDQTSAAPLASDFRRGSVGATPNRENNGARDLSDGIYFRRARFGVEGVLARDFNYRFLLELGGSGTEGPARINDAWINYTGFAPFTLQLGAFSPPANLDDGTAPEDALFIERASPAELSRSLGGADGRLGFGVRGNGTRWMGSLTLTGRTVGDAEAFDSQTALVGRAAVLIASGADYNVHTGLSTTYVLHPNDQGLDANGARYGIRFRDRPELRVDSTRLIDTGSIDADHAYAAGAELAANWRNLFFQAENFWFGVERRDVAALSDPSFGGYYLESSWIITGESRRYNMVNGSFQNPRPFVPFSANGGMGAWELALRFSHTDLNDNAGSLGFAPVADSVRGGEQDIWTVGVNWYINSNLKFLLNYFNVDVNRLNPAGPGNPTPFGASPATPPLGVSIGQSLNVYALRAQLAF